MPQPQPNDLSPDSPLDRRDLLRGLAAAGVASGLPQFRVEAAQPQPALNGRIRQSVVFWCFNAAGEKWDVDRTCRVALELGCRSVEIVAPEHWGVLRKHKLICALAP